MIANPSISYLQTLRQVSALKAYCLKVGEGNVLTMVLRPMNIHESGFTTCHAIQRIFSRKPND